MYVVNNHRLRFSNLIKPQNIKGNYAKISNNSDVPVYVSNINRVAIDRLPF